MAYVIPAPPQPAVRIAGSDDLFPVHRVYCVGRNYAEHAREMGHDPDREPPFFFQKHPGALIDAGEPGGGEVPYPPLTNDLHHEIEMVVALKEGGTDIPEDRALGLIWGYGVALDMTRRDIQGEAKKMGRPWDAGKSFVNACPIGRLHSATEVGHPENGAVWLDVNGARRQTGDLAQLIWKVPEIIAHVSSLFVLQPGDLILTGTPAGVGAVNKGDELHGGVDGLGEIRTRLA